MTMTTELNKKIKKIYTKHDRKKFLIYDKTPTSKHPVLKNVFDRILKPATVVFVVATFVFGVVAVNFAQDIMKMISDRNKARLHPETKGTDMFVPVERNEDGTINPYPIVSEEMVSAYNFLGEKLMDDIYYFGETLPYIEKICGIYRHSLYGEEFSKDSLIQIVFEAAGQKYILEYTAFEEDFGDEIFKVNTSINENETLISLTENMAMCYPSNFIKPTAEKAELEGLFENFDGIIGDIVYYTKDALTTCYQIPVYTNDECTVYSITENTLAEHSEDMSIEDIYTLFKEYLEKKNEFFTEEKVEKIEDNDAVIAAINYGKKISEQYFWSNYVEHGEVKVEVEDPKDYGLEP